MEDEKSLFEKIKERLKKYVKWYLYPLIYFLVTSLVFVYAWYRPYPRGAVKIIFKTIALAPAIFWAGVITLWIFVVILFTIISFYLKKRFPEVFSWSRFKTFSRSKEEKKAPQTFLGKIVSSLFYSLGFLLIFTGITLGVWIARPYITLLLSSSKIEALEKKVHPGQVQGNRIIIPSVLVDVPIVEGMDRKKLSQGVCHVTNSPFPGEGGNCIIEGHNLAEFGFWRPQSFFSILEVVEKGSPIYVFFNGKKYVYKVKEKIYRDVGDPKLYDTTPGERLTLITCVSTWSPTIYTNKRTIISAYPEF